MDRRRVAERWRPVCPACGFIHYINPVVAAGTLVEQNGQVVLVRRGVEPGKGLWCLPAGYVEADESAEAAAIRETREECGLEVELDGLIDVFSFGQDETSRGVLILYAAHVVGGSLQPGDDAIEAAFFSPETLPPDEQIAFWTHRQALAAWRRARAIRFRRAGPAEARRAEDLCRAFDLSPCLLRPRDDTSTGELIVALDGDQVVGFASVSVARDTAQGTLEQVFVHPDYRRWGIGTRLLRQAVASARSLGLETLTTQLDADNVAIGAFLKAGFHICGFLGWPGKASPVLFLIHDLAEVSLDPSQDSAWHGPLW